MRSKDSPLYSPIDKPAAGRGPQAPSAQLDKLDMLDYAERPGDLAEDVGRRLAQAPFDLAEVRVRHAGQLRALAQRTLRSTR